MSLSTLDVLNYISGVKKHTDKHSLESREFVSCTVDFNSFANLKHRPAFGIVLLDRDIELKISSSKSRLLSLDIMDKNETYKNVDNKDLMFNNVKLMSTSALSSDDFYNYSGAGVKQYEMSGYTDVEKEYYTALYDLTFDKAAVSTIYQFMLYNRTNNSIVDRKQLFDVLEHGVNSGELLSVYRSIRRLDTCGINAEYHADNHFSMLLYLMYVNLLRSTEFNINKVNLNKISTFGELDIAISNFVDNNNSIKSYQSEEDLLSQRLSLYSYEGLLHDKCVKHIGKVELDMLDSSNRFDIMKFLYYFDEIFAFDSSLAKRYEILLNTFSENLKSEDLK